MKWNCSIFLFFSLWANLWGNSLVADMPQMGKIKIIDVTILVYTPGWDDSENQEMEVYLSDQIESLLTKEGFLPSFSFSEGEGSPFLEITVETRNDPDFPDVTAIFVALKLQDFVILERLPGVDFKGTTWEWEEFDLVPTEEAEGILIETTLDGLDDFIGIAKRERGQETPSDMEK